MRYAKMDAVDGGKHEILVGVRAASQCAQGTNPTKCAENICEMVDTTEVCTQCKQNFVPTNEVCEAAASNAKCKDAVSSAGTDQTCKMCLLQTFMFKGGCYDKGAAPGNLICTDEASGITIGLCDVCKEADGYFKNPANVATSSSCILCNNTTGVTIGESNNAKTYTGIASCVKCTKPDQLSAPGTNAATCTECNANLYLKTVSSPTSATSCVSAEDCKTRYFPNDNADSKKKCLACSDNNNGGIENCGECSLLPSTSRAATPLVTCTKCSTNNLSPLKNECMASCPAGTYDNSNVCTPCHTSCSECTDDAESSCTACYPGSVLSYGSDSTKGTCIPECTGKYLENCADGQCTASIAGSKYCSRCKSGFVPVDGLCVSATTRAPTGCTPSNTDGVCTACTEAYFLQSGGCYKAGAFPGNAICTTAQSGACQTCTTTGRAPNSGVCPSCPDGCANCKTNTNQCDTCYSGYYKSGSKCFKRTADSNESGSAITGVKDCVSCAPPATPPGPVTCYVTQEPSVNPTDPSVNKGGLSSGAIAGISVAVIAVVGGLVGFLCWWFVCRGKA